MNPPSAEQSDLSVRLPVLLFFTGAIGWFVLGNLVYLLSLIKLHAPAMMAGVPALTYGRLVPAQSAMLLYGFASQAAMGLILWMICRLGRTLLFGKTTLLLVGALWNLTVLIGVVAILGGNLTGLDRFDLPRSAASFILLAFFLYGICALITFHRRTERDLYPSMWWILAAIFFFVWVFAAGYILLQAEPVSGALQPIIATWFSNNIVALWLVPVGAAVVYYFLPKLSGKPLAGYSAAVFSFWAWVLFSSLTGFQYQAAVPRWLPALSAVAAVLSTVPALGMGLAWHQTYAPTKNSSFAGILRMVRFASLIFVIGVVLAALSGVPQTSRNVPQFAELLAYTLWPQGLAQGTFYGFFTLAAVAAMIGIVPTLFNSAPSSLSTGKAFPTMMIAGTLLLILPLLLGGIVQGNALANSSLPFVEATRKTLPFVGISMIGVLILIICGLMMLRDLYELTRNSCMECCGDWVGGGSR
ncbi:MAG: cbb3-type cytochrome c oxidase subunit I [Verrucomicrobiota bacterium]|nr:cbb3-type cytochrome c oxidase subunit I [Verrucomicrobiota bacterium]